MSKKNGHTEKPGNILGRYLKEIGEIDMLDDVKEEVKLAQEIKTGNEKSLERLIEANLRFVVSVAKQYQNNGLSLEDLINEGNLGLIVAAKKFDETIGVKFISYAVHDIRRCICEALENVGRSIRIPSHWERGRIKLNKKINEFQGKHHRDPTPEEVLGIFRTEEEIAKDLDKKGQKALNTERNRIKGILERKKKPDSLEKPFVSTTVAADNENGCLLSVLEDKESSSPEIDSIRESLRKDIDIVLAQLIPEEAEVIKLYLGLNLEDSLTLQEIGEKYGRSREGIRLIKNSALKNLKISEKLGILEQYSNEPSINFFQSN